MPDMQGMPTLRAPPPEMRKMFSTRPRASMKQAPAAGEGWQGGRWIYAWTHLRCWEMHISQSHRKRAAASPQLHFNPSPPAPTQRTSSRVDGCAAADERELTGDGGRPLLHPGPILLDDDVPANQNLVVPLILRRGREGLGGQDYGVLYSTARMGSWAGK